MGWLGRLFGAKPDQGFLRQARALADEDRLDEAIERYAAYCGRHADDAQAYLELARLLVKAGREDEAAEFVFDLTPDRPAVLLAQGETALAIGEIERAIALLAGARDGYRAALKSIDRNPYAQRGHDEASFLHDHAYAELHGREQVIVEHAARATLDARASVNYQLLGDSLMVGTSRRAESVRLESLADMQRRYDSLRPDEQRGARGRLLLGAIAYREGLADDAVAQFQRAVEIDGAHFAAFRGLGAAMAMREENTPRAATLLPAVASESWSGLAQVVPDLAALTTLERRIVLCSIEPLRFALPTLARRSTRICLMPFDVRTTDHPEFADDDAHRVGGDARSLGALSGVAGASLALVRLDELYVVRGAHSWTFAHEFAHLAHRYMLPGIVAQVRDAHARAAASGFVGGSYAQSNDREFLAVSYADYVLRRYVTLEPPEADPLGIGAEMNALFDRMASDAACFSPPHVARAPCLPG